MCLLKLTAFRRVVKACHPDPEHDWQLHQTLKTILPGLQLTLDNALAPYLNTQFGFSITKAGNLAAIYGLLNFGARPAGGILSDVLGKRFGIRGRIWALFMVLALGGLFTSLVGVLVNYPFKVTLAMYILSGVFLEVITRSLSYPCATSTYPLPMCSLCANQAICNRVVTVFKKGMFMVGPHRAT